MDGMTNTLDMMSSSASVMLLNFMYLCHSGLASESRDYECNGLHDHLKTISTGPLTFGLLTTALSVVYSAIRAGSSTILLSPPSSPRAGMDEDEEREEGYYFTQRSKKYPNGSRPSRFVHVKGSDDQAISPQPQGFWKMSCKMDDIRDPDGNLLGKKNSLNYFSGSVKTEWKMHEFMLHPSLVPSKKDGKSDVLDEMVLCKVYRYIKDDKSKDRKQGKAAETPQIRRCEGELSQQISSTRPETSQRPLKLKQPSSYRQEQSNKRALAAAPIARTVEQPSAYPVPLTLVRQVPSTAQPDLTHLVRAQTTLTELSMPLPLQPIQNHIVYLAPAQGGGPVSHFVPNEAQLPQCGESTFFVSQPQQPQYRESTFFVPQQPQYQDFNNLCAQYGDLIFQHEQPNFLADINIMTAIESDLQFNFTDSNLLSTDINSLQSGVQQQICHDFTILQPNTLAFTQSDYPHNDSKF
ncbi:uncharacterized protein LOC111280558 [Durio zibethinus]|uniref:Uncharacterized protein LOC111280558 n=1 Tax=Durio zibethinus TaxID=66656 RepID=A0A6P5X5U7_DURZI|nr:uncharacterized protein LOC111280558 [Durio zibethinus]